MEKGKKRGKRRKAGKKNFERGKMVMMVILLGRQIYILIVRVIDI